MTRRFAGSDTFHIQPYKSYMRCNNACCRLYLSAIAVKSLLDGVGGTLCGVVRAAPVQLTRKSISPTSARESREDERLDRLSEPLRLCRVAPIPSPPMVIKGNIDNYRSMPHQ